MKHGTKVLLTLALSGVTAAPTMAQVEIKGFGSTIRVGPDNGEGSDVDVDLPGLKVQSRAPSTPPPGTPPPGTLADGGRVIDVPAAATVTKTYRIGLAGGDISPELRLHLGLEGVGVMVREVTPGGAADKAGVEKFDILLSADGAPLATIQDLVTVVRTAGPKQQPIAIELLRRGKSITIHVTPEEQEVAPAPPDPFGANPFGRDPFGKDPFGGGPDGDPFANDGPLGGFNFRMFGPGVAIGQGGGLNFGGNAQVFANGVSVRVQSQNGRSVVTAQKGDQKWEFDAGDQQAIAQLPPDVRQLVQQVTAGGGGVEIDLNQLAPLMQGLLEGRGDRRDRGGLAERLMEMQRRLLEQAGGGGFEGGAPPAAGGDAPGFGGGEAPVFDPGGALAPAQPAKPIEIEIPAESDAAEEE